MKKFFVSAVMAFAAFQSIPASAQSFFNSSTGHPDTYNRGQAMQSGYVSSGTVVAVRTVSLESSGVSKTIGGVIGAVLGAAVTNGRPGYVQAAAGVIGGSAGAYGASVVTTASANEIIVDQGNGQSRVIVQEQGQYVPRVGQRVRLLSTGSETRIIQ